MKLSPLVWLVLCTVALAPPHTRAAIPEKFDPADYLQPKVCPGTHTFDAAGTCVPNLAVVKTLTKDACKAAGFEFADGATQCAVGSAKALTPACKAIPGYAATATGSGKSAVCGYERTLPSNASGDYIGDCFHVKAVPPGTSLIPEQYYFVSAQTNVDPDDDRLLTLLPGDIRWVPLGCKATGGPAQTVTASTLLASGASRYGYSYGFLTMPYKYFPGDKSFVVSAPIGGFMGWRYGMAGSGTTVAAALTLGTVKADTVDPTRKDADGKPVVTGSADVSALSFAVGLMFDVLKSPRGKPFKAGLFVGQDRVSADPSVVYRHNRKTWIAVQIGYDFTDN